MLATLDGHHFEMRRIRESQAHFSLTRIFFLFIPFYEIKKDSWRDKVSSLFDTTTTSFVRQIEPKYTLTLISTILN